MFRKTFQDHHCYLATSVSRLFTTLTVNTKPRMFPASISSFEILRSTRSPCFFVDKSMLIKKLLESRINALWLTRPRKWGKTVNLSMLRAFFQPKTYENGYPISKALNMNEFNNLKISKESLSFDPITNESKETKIMNLRASLPVITLSFRDACPTTKKDLLLEFARVLKPSLLEHDYLRNSKKQGTHHLCDLISTYQEDLESISKEEIENSLSHLVSALHLYYGRPVVLLVDDFDSLLLKLASCDSKLFKYGCDLINSLFADLKNNPMVKLAIFTGESPLINTDLFPNLNHFIHDSVLSSDFHEFFGFTEPEVEELLENLLDQRKDLSFSSVKREIMNWYKGYQIGGSSLYNPWSVMHCLENLRLKLPEPFWNYWRNEDSIEFFTKITPNLKSSQLLKQLIDKSYVNFEADTRISFQSVCEDESSVLTLMLHSGFISKLGNKGYGIPNKEMRKNFDQNLTDLVKIQ